MVDSVAGGTSRNSTRYFTCTCTLFGPSVEPSNFGPDFESSELNFDDGRNVDRKDDPR